MWGTRLHSPSRHLNVCSDDGTTSLSSKLFSLENKLFSIEYIRGLFLSFFLSSFASVYIPPTSSPSSAQTQKQRSEERIGRQRNWFNWPNMPLNVTKLPGTATAFFSLYSLVLRRCFYKVSPWNQLQIMSCRTLTGFVSFKLKWAQKLWEFLS